MIDIRGFFEKFKKLDGGRALRLSGVMEVVEKVGGVKLKEEEIVFESKGDYTDLRIKTSPLKRSEIFMRVEKILEELKSKGVNIRKLL